MLYVIGVETEELSDCQGRAGTMSILPWDLRPVIFGVEICSGFSDFFRDFPNLSFSSL